MDGDICELQETVLSRTFKNFCIILDPDINIHTPIPFNPPNFTVQFQGEALES